MLDQIILLTDDSLVGAVKPLLEAVDPRVKVNPVLNVESLKACFQSDLSKTRLVSFGTDIIVPKKFLDALPSPAYNLHPGPPSCPGRYPSVFAIYNEIETFGSTVHEMTEAVDAGPIVAVDYFAMPEGVDRQTLDFLSFQSALTLISKLSPRLVSEGRLEPIDQGWSGKKNTQKDFEALCQLPHDVTEDEFLHRYRAVGEGPNHALEINLFGHRFTLNNQREQNITVGGQAKS